MAASVPEDTNRSCSIDGTNDDTGQPFYGIACLQADGRWHIVED